MLYQGVSLSVRGLVPCSSRISIDRAVARNSQHIIRTQLCICSSFGICSTLQFSNLLVYCIQGTRCVQRCSQQKRGSKRCTNEREGGSTLRHDNLLKTIGALLYHTSLHNTHDLIPVWVAAHTPRTIRFNYNSASVCWHTYHR